MRSIFLDCGAHCGCSRRKFLKDHPEFIAFSFEPDPDFNQYCPDLINKAVWIENCHKTFFKFKIDGGSSLYEDRVKILKQRKPSYFFEPTQMTVECFDLDLFIKDHFSTDDFIVLKLDIEGAEYEVLPHLINNGSIAAYIDELYIEWHDDRVGVSKSKNLEITKTLEGLGIPVKLWDAMVSKDCAYIRSL